jgi:hypothetical protein
MNGLAVKADRDWPMSGTSARLVDTPLPADAATRWEAAYRAFIGFVDGWFTSQDIDRDDQAELLFLAEQEIINEAMRFVYSALSGIRCDTQRLDYLRRVPDPVPPWMQLARFVRSKLGMRASYVPRVFFRPDKDICTFHQCAVSVAYARERGVKPRLMSAGEWFPSPRVGDDVAYRGLGPEIIELLGSAYEAACTVAGIPNSNRAEALDTFQKFARRIDFWRASLRTHRNKLPYEFWTSTMGYPLHRVLARAVRRNKGTVVGFDHGSGSGMWISDFQTRIELGFVDRFITFGPAMAEGLRQNMALVAGRCVIPEVHALNIVRSLPGHRAERSPVRKVVYVAASYSGDKFMSPPLYDNNRMIQWQRLLLAKLKALGLEVAIKPHPESLDGPAKQFERDLGIRIIPGRFEDVTWQDTAFVFDSPESSAFPQAMATGAPVVVFDLPRLKIRPEARRLLSRRVAFVPVWFDSSECLQTDWSALPGAIDRSRELADNEVLRRYFGIEEVSV